MLSARHVLPSSWLHCAPWWGLSSLLPSSVVPSHTSSQPCTYPHWLPFLFLRNLVLGSGGQCLVQYDQDVRRAWLPLRYVRRSSLRVLFLYRWVLLLRQSCQCLSQASYSLIPPLALDDYSTGAPYYHLQSLVQSYILIHSRQTIGWSIALNLTKGFL